jgi:hypothetical protein
MPLGIGRRIRPVRLPLMLLLAVVGLLLLATPALPVGLALLGAAWWVYEKTGRRDDEGFVGLLMVLGGLGAGAYYLQYLIEIVRRLL